MSKSLITMVNKLQKAVVENDPAIEAEKARAEQTAKWFESLSSRQKQAVQLWVSRQKLVEEGIAKGYLISPEDLASSYQTFDGRYLRLDETFLDITVCPGGEFDHHPTITGPYHPEGVWCVRRRPKIHWPALKFNQAFMEQLAATEQSLEDTFIDLYNNARAEWSGLVDIQVSRMNHEFWQYSWRVIDHLYKFDSMYEGHGIWCDFDNYCGKESWLKQQ